MSERVPPLLMSILAVGIAILYIPMLVLIGYSFNASALVSVWGGFTTDWYAQLLHNEQILDAAWLSLKIGVTVSTGSVILGTLAAIALVRFKAFRGRLLLTGMVNAPLVMPEIVTGITQLLLFVSMLHLFGWPHRGFTTIVIAHIAFCTAYVTITVQSRLHGADRSLEEAAMDLGSGPVRAFVDTTLPGIAPALASSWLLSFTLSLGRSGDIELRVGPGREHAADGDIFEGEAGGQSRRERPRQPHHLPGRHLRSARRSADAPHGTPATGGRPDGGTLTQPAVTYRVSCAGRVKIRCTRGSKLDSGSQW